ncbi:hypothetical protein AQUCO_01900005v1 [Aquilegia coerulea]|uniref:DSBA-like thioredoxin domain-containing protein n=1 Tax=Aquilegia coerulea TaxID=218851 RepID=A0A2G5DIK2_AQUCA|nr:hypothetical protein AQUCO_01900005v1 [Aquilegia coerulea]
MHIKPNNKAIASSKDQFDFEIRWHPFILNPSAPTEGVVKEKFYMEKYGPQSLRIEARTAEVFRSLGLDYDVKGLTGNSLEGHRIIDYAGRQALDKQHALVEEICLGYFTKGKYIGDREFLLEAAKKVGIEGAEEFLNDPKNGLQEVYADLEKYSGSISGVPFYVINGKRKLSGSQQPEVFVRAFQDAAKEN